MNIEIWVFAWWYDKSSTVFSCWIKTWKILECCVQIDSTHFFFVIWHRVNLFCKHYRQLGSFFCFLAFFLSKCHFYFLASYGFIYKATVSQNLTNIIKKIFLLRMQTNHRCLGGESGGMIFRGRRGSKHISKGGRF